MRYIPRLVVLELTRRCSLRCVHCRASAGGSDLYDELDTEEWRRLLKDIASFSKPIIILSGGEPLLREDVFDIITYGREAGLTMSLSTCGITLTEKTAAKLKESGIGRVSVSIDGKDAAAHDFIRQQKGAHDAALRAIDTLKRYGIAFQINTTVTKYNFKHLNEILELAIDLGAASFHPFFLVPVGRARDLKDFQLNACEYEWSLEKLHELTLGSPIHCRPICAPHYFRIYSGAEGALKGNPQGNGGLDAMTAGCLGGKSFAFVSSSGKVQICGFLKVECGDLKQDDFSKIWRSSTVFNNLRNFSRYKGKCNICEYIDLCGGCRARAYEATGDYLEEEPECVYQPLRAGY